MAAFHTALRRPCVEPSMSHTSTGKVTNSTGHALTGAMERAEAAPATKAIEARFQPKARTTACAARVTKRGGRSTLTTLTGAAIRLEDWPLRWLRRRLLLPSRGGAARVPSRGAPSAAGCARAKLEDVGGVVGHDLEVGDAAEEVDTLGGYLVTRAGRLPLRGELIPGPGLFEFEVLDADPRRIKRVRILRLKERREKAREPRRPEAAAAGAASSAEAASTPPAGSRSS